MRDTLSKILPAPIKNQLEPIYRRGRLGVRYLRSKPFEIADQHQLIGPDTIYDDEYYIKRKDEPFRSDSRAVSEAVYNEFTPSSVIDFGCAIGNHLELFYNNGVDVHGVEGNQTAIQYAVIPSRFIEQYDLRQEYDPRRNFDIALCFETAEHIPKRFDDALVNSLASASSTVVFTAAPPGQPGKHHVNLQQRDYWKSKFTARGMTYNQDIVERLRSEIEVEDADWIPDNLFVFQSNMKGD